MSVSPPAFQQNLFALAAMEGVGAVHFGIGQADPSEGTSLASAQRYLSSLMHRSYADKALLLSRF